MKAEFNSVLRNTKLLPSLAYEKRQRNIKYLMELKTENLLFSFYVEAGLAGTLARVPDDLHQGWDGPLSQIRGTFTGHWLSAAARIYNETNDMQLKAKADYIVAEIARCAEANGGGWAFPIPEKYLHAIKRGQHFWAPQYVCHKVMMGLLDMYQFADNKQAFELLLGCADWFYNFTNDITRENMDNMMDIEETGGIMELWADLYGVTNDPKHLELTRRYERPHLTQPLLDGIDVLTNLHANTTVPEIQGCARAYEVTGESRFRDIVEKYWDLAVTKRGTYATGGQTAGEIWTPIEQQAARLSDMNQEHCVVYNMIRLADYLYRWTGDAVYADYIERNIWNGLFAQGFWQDTNRDMINEPHIPDTGLVAYYLPLAPGSTKQWGSKTDDFWCCHCTLVQANAKYREFIYYISPDSTVTIAQYLPSKLSVNLDGKQIEIEQTYTDLSGENITIKPVARKYPNRPSFMSVDFRVKVPADCNVKLRFRLPSWLSDKANFQLNGVSTTLEAIDGYANIKLESGEQLITAVFPKSLTAYPLPDRTSTVAFLDGPVVLAGLTPVERVLYGDVAKPETLISPFDERRWTAWSITYHTLEQDFGFKFKPLFDIGKEAYTVYFPIKPSK